MGVDELDEVRTFAAGQHGAVGVRQLVARGWSSWRIDDLCRHHGWIRVTSQVLRVAGAPDTRAQRVSCAVLDVGPGAYLSHESAAAWWGHRGSRLERPIHVVTTRVSTRRSNLARVHRVRHLDDRWVTDLAGVPVVRPELVAMHLFASCHYQRAERIVESMWSQRLLSGRSLGNLLRDVGKRGRNGTAGLRLYVDARQGGYEPPDSGLETRVQRILGDAGIALRRQVNLGDARHWSARVDFLLPDLGLVLEVQSEVHHSSLRDRSADLERIAKLERQGFLVVEVTDEMVWTDPAAVIRAVRARSVFPR